MAPATTQSPTAPCFARPQPRPSLPRRAREGGGRRGARVGGRGGRPRGERLAAGRDGPDPRGRGRARVGGGEARVRGLLRGEGPRARGAPGRLQAQLHGRGQGGRRALPARVRRAFPGARGPRLGGPREERDGRRGGAEPRPGPPGGGRVPARARPAAPVAQRRVRARGRGARRARAPQGRGRGRGPQARGHAATLLAARDVGLQRAGDDGRRVDPVEPQGALPHGRLVRGRLRGHAPGARGRVALPRGRGLARGPLQRPGRGARADRGRLRGLFGLPAADERAVKRPALPPRLARRGAAGAAHAGPERAAHRARGRRDRAPQEAEEEEDDGDVRGLRAAGRARDRPVRRGRAAAARGRRARGRRALPIPRGHGEHRLERRVPLPPRGLRPQGRLGLGRALRRSFRIPEPGRRRPLGRVPAGPGAGRLADGRRGRRRLQGAGGRAHPGGRPDQGRQPQARGRGARRRAGRGPGVPRRAQVHGRVRGLAPDVREPRAVPRVR
mmetsp:Transcript_1441/g.4333  ORF Transcript_1441/g.4333 Transcript_1441/m.4333 type:complete len:501 (+) Transcript_1441:130-1632(+)